jgi:23S rRNA (cytidine2498-2'-O)-methyltransferase
VTTAYLAAEGFEAQLIEELARADVRVRRRHHRLLVCDDPPIAAAWAANTWYDVETIGISSIGEAARALRERQRSWAVYAPEHHGRAGLVQAKLPHVSARPLALGDTPPAAPLGSWTLLAPTVVLAAARCASPFPHGEPRFVEDRAGPPSRAYLKLWEALVRIGRRPSVGDRCLDLGASPGGWTWLLAQFGADVVAVDKAPLDPAVAAIPGVTWRQGSAFGLDPAVDGPVDWLCSDVVAYPDRLLELVERWIEADAARTIVCTIKFQGPTDHDVVRRFAALPDAQVVHLHHNKHELTLAVLH